AGIVDANPRRAANLAAGNRDAAIFDPELCALGDRQRVEGLIDRQALGQTARTDPFPGTAQQDGGRMPVAIGYGVEHPVHAVTEINVPTTGWTEERLGARGATFGSVTGQIVRADIGLSLVNDGCDRLAIDFAHEVLSEQLTGYEERRP